MQIYIHIHIYIYIPLFLQTLVRCCETRYPIPQKTAFSVCRGPRDPGTSLSLLSLSIYISLPQSNRGAMPCAKFPQLEGRR